MREGVLEDGKCHIVDGSSSIPAETGLGGKEGKYGQILPALKLTSMRANGSESLTSH
jgi:hypothetical protein